MATSSFCEEENLPLSHSGKFLDIFFILNPAVTSFISFRACTCETRVAFGAIFDQLLFPVITSRNAVFIEKILQNYN